LRLIQALRINTHAHTITHTYIQVKMEEMMTQLAAHSRLRCPSLSKDTYATVCGHAKWCALLSVESAPSSRQAANLEAAADEIFKSKDVVVQVGVVSASQGAALQVLGVGKPGDMVIIRRPEHGIKDPGHGSYDAWSIASAEAASDMAQRIGIAIEGKQRPKVGGGQEQALIDVLVVYRAPLLTRVLEQIDDLSVEKQIVLYVVFFSFSLSLARSRSRARALSLPPPSPPPASLTPGSPSLPPSLFSLSPPHF
jgi:hypothetical protein